MKINNSKKGYLLAAITIFCWSTMAPFAKLLLQEIHFTQVLMMCGGVAGIFLWIVIALTGRWKIAAEYDLWTYVRLAALGLLGLCCYGTFYYTGLTLMPARDACIINYLWPITTVIFAMIILREKVRPRRIVAILISFMGVSVVAYGGEAAEASYGDGYLIGAFCCFMAAVCYGLFCVLNKKFNKNQMVSMAVFFSATSICGGIMCFALGKFTLISFNVFLGILWIGIMVDAVAYLCWALALQNSDASKIANTAYLTPIVSVIMCALVLGESFSLYSLAGLGMILCGSFLNKG